MGDRSWMHSEHETTRVTRLERSLARLPVSNSRHFIILLAVTILVGLAFVAAAIL